MSLAVRALFGLNKFLRQPSSFARAFFDTIFSGSGGGLRNNLRSGHKVKTRRECIGAAI